MSTNVRSRSQERGQAETAQRASHVLSEMLLRIPERAARLESLHPPLATDHLCALAEALGGSDGLFQERISRIQRLYGVSAETIIDIYIPALARELGEDWTNDRRSFAEVTICMSRLAMLVRELTRGVTADSVAPWDAPVVGMILPENEQHTLGAAVAASRLRRAGVSVQIMAGRSIQDIIDSVERLHLDMIAVSIGTTDRLENTRKLVKMLRKNIRNLPPIVAGGAVSGNKRELVAYLDVDHVTSDPIEALRKCALTAIRSSNPCQAET